MPLVADIHIHSHYSRATSKDLDLEHLCHWAQLKGVHVVGTGDISHPGWLKELQQKLEPAEQGLFRLKPDIARAVQAGVPTACQSEVRFLLAGEISNIYKRGDRVRKVHNLVYMPSLHAVEKLQTALERIGNIRSDGRPILGLDSRDLLDITLNIDPLGNFIPAHIWTPWFSMLGSMSGFDTVEECFGDLSEHIFALETGLSSDPPMNWRVSNLDRYTLISNSDAHSPPKLAREATLIKSDLAYTAIFDALKRGGAAVGTLEFFPEEGKYHYDGHRKCEIRWDPVTTLEHGGLCSVCGKPVTVGVMHRVETLADRPAGAQTPRVQAYQRLIPLPEILAEVYRVGESSKQVTQAYDALLNKLGSELYILREAPLEDIRFMGGELLAEGVRRVRAGELSIAAGYDGEYGTVKLFSDDERATFTPQMDLFGASAKPIKRSAKMTPEKQTAAEGRTSPTDATELHANMPLTVTLSAAQSPAGRPGTLSSPDEIPGSTLDVNQRLLPPYLPLAVSMAQPDPSTNQSPTNHILDGLNAEQRAAAECIDTSLIIVAGPGTGKTRTLTHRIAYLIGEQGVLPSSILAITFTNKAAEEMAERLTRLVGQAIAQQITVKTFHALGASILRSEAAHLGLDPAFAILSEDERHSLLKRLAPSLAERDLSHSLELISTAKNNLWRPNAAAMLTLAPDNPQWPGLYQAYATALRQSQALDFDDLIAQTVYLWQDHPDVLRLYQSRFRWISVDEYQDINQAQYRLLRLLAGPDTNLCAIGDPDQAIYGFRGADRAYFLEFQTDFPGARRMSLTKNYRSTQLILDASGQVIATGPDRQPRPLYSDQGDATKLDIYRAATDKAEAEFVVHTIERMTGGTSLFSIDSGRVANVEGAGGYSFADFAVLYRLSAQSQPLIEAFQRSGIPYQTIGQTPLADYSEIRLILAFLWLALNPDSHAHLEQVLKAHAVRAKPQVEDFIIDLRLQVSERPVASLIEATQEFILTQRPDSLDDRQLDRIQLLRRRAIPYAHRLQDFLEATVLQRETDYYDARADRVTLMTLHASKGLEFPVVFIVGCEDTLLPYQMPGKTSDVDEERRLFYVGMTRAQQRLFLTHARTRFLFGRQVDNPPSPFLSDIEDTLKVMSQATARKVAEDRSDAVQLKLW